MSTGIGVLNQGSALPTGTGTLFGQQTAGTGLLILSSMVLHHLSLG